MEDIFLAGSLCWQDPGSCHTRHPGFFPQTPKGEQRRCCIHGIGGDQKVSVVKECDAGHLYDEHVDKLNGQHEHQLSDAADLQEHGAGQQAEQHAVGEVLQRQGAMSDPSSALTLPGPSLTWPGGGTGGGRAWFLLKVASQEVKGKVSSLARKRLEMGSRLKWNLEGDTGPRPVLQAQADLTHRPQFHHQQSLQSYMSIHRH